jgi:hypothetical protein
MKNNATLTLGSLGLAVLTLSALGCSSDTGGKTESTHHGSGGMAGGEPDAASPATGGGAATGSGGEATGGVTSKGGSSGTGGAKSTGSGGSGAGGVGTAGAGGSGSGGKPSGASGTFGGAGGPQMTTTSPGGCGKAVDSSAGFQPNTWKNLSPADAKIRTDTDEHVFTLGIELDPSNPSTIYVTVSGDNVATTDFIKGNVCKSTDGGATWAPIGNFDQPINVRVDPKDPQHLYVGDGVRGGTMGFWVTTDGGKTWTMPQGYKNIATQLADSDVYHVAPDPADFNHVLVTFHSGWHGCDDYGFGHCNAGIIESKDGGYTWVAKNPMAGWAGYGGWDVWFLSNPEKGVGDSNTWLFGNQDHGGYWRTTDAGETWTQATTASMAHGGAQLFYAANGDLYTGAWPYPIRSSDNGKSWTKLEKAPYDVYFSVVGDGDTLFTAPGDGGNFVTSKDGNTWTQFNDQKFSQGPFEMAVDHTNHIIYASMWGAGVWALKL